MTDTKHTPTLCPYCLGYGLALTKPERDVLKRRWHGRTAENWATLLGAFLLTCPATESNHFVLSLVEDMTEEDALVLNIGMDRAAREAQT